VLYEARGGIEKLTFTSRILLLLLPPPPPHQPRQTGDRLASKRRRTRDKRRSKARAVSRCTRSWPGPTLSTPAAAEAVAPATAELAVPMSSCSPAPSDPPDPTGSTLPPLDLPPRKLEKNYTETRKASNRFSVLLKSKVSSALRRISAEWIPPHLT
jgi:hypothetical protein